MKSARAIYSDIEKASAFSLGRQESLDSFLRASRPQVQPQSRYKRMKPLKDLNAEISLKGGQHSRRCSRGYHWCDCDLAKEIRALADRLPALVRATKPAEQAEEMISGGQA